MIQQQQNFGVIRRQPQQQNMDGDEKKQEQKEDPYLLQMQQENYNRGKTIANTPFQPYTNERVAGLGPIGTFARDSILNWATDPSAANTLDSAVKGMSDFSTYAPKTITSPGQLSARFIAQPDKLTARNVTAPTITAPQTYTAQSVTAPEVASSGTLNPNSITAGKLRDTDLTDYMNPFLDEVVGGTLKDLERARKIQQVGDMQRQTAEKAFGGGRHAVADSLTNDRYLDASDRASRELRLTGYDKAVAAATSDLDRAYGADQFNAGQRFAADQFNITGARDLARENADRSYNASLFNANATNDAAKFNTGNLFDLEKFRAGMLYDADRANADRTMNADQFNITNAMNVDNANSTIGMATDKYNLDNALDISKTNATNDLTGAGLRYRGLTSLADLADKQNDMGLTRIGAIQGLGEQEREIEQARRDADYAEYLRQFGYPASTQELLNSTISRYPSQPTTTTSTSPGFGSYATGVGSLGLGLAQIGQQNNWWDAAADTSDFWNMNGGGYNAFSDPFFGT